MHQKIGLYTVVEVNRLTKEWKIHMGEKVNKKATLKDVADLAGVSTATVSYVLNHSKSISEEVKRNVYSAMKALNYRPNTLAKSLRMKESKLIGLMISDIANTFFSSIVRGIEDELSESGYSVLLCNTDSNVEKEENYLDVLLGRRVDGLIVSAAGQTGEYFEALQSIGVPIVFLNRCPDFCKSDIVVTDNIAGAYAATEHLIEHGYKNISIIAGPQSISTGRERFVGFKRAMESKGRPMEKDLIKQGLFDEESGYKLMKEIMEQTNRPDAVFICNNSMTLGAYKYIKEVNITIPDQVAIVGFDDPEWATIVDPPLTAVEQPAYEQGKDAAKLIVEKLKGEATSKQQIIALNPSLKVRGSCGCK